MSPRLSTLLLAAAAPATIAPQAPAPIGSYALVSAGAHELPIVVSRVIPHEGTTLHSGLLQLMPGGKMSASIIVSYTDSGTVTDTILAAGEWSVAGDSVRLTYRWSRPRWQGGPRVYEPGRAVSGRLSRSEFTLAEFAYFNEPFFGNAAPLRFRRVP